MPVPPAGSRAARAARRAWPYMLMAWERWNALPPEEKERYRQRFREYRERGRSTLERARTRRRPPGPPGPPRV